MALMTTVWVSLFMALTAATIATLTRTDSGARRNASDLIKAQALAKSALHLAIADLAEPVGRARFAHDGTLAVLRLDGDTLSIGIEDERGKLDLRLSPRQHVEALFRILGAAQGLDSFDAVTLAQRITTLLNVQDPSDPRAAAVQSLGSLASIDGLSRRLYTSLLHHATVFGFGPEVNPMTATRETLSAIEGLGPSEIKSIELAKSQGSVRPALPRAERWLTNLEGPVYTIIATGRLSNGIEATVTTVVGSHGVGLASTTPQFSILESR